MLVAIGLDPATLLAAVAPAPGTLIDRRHHRRDPTYHGSYMGRAMIRVWSCLRQFTCTKFVIVVDDIHARDCAQVLWALSARVDPARDTVLVEDAPIDCVDVASPSPGSGRSSASMQRANGPARACAPGAGR